ncbi:SH3 domain-containing protein [Streptomyces sp. NBC_01136]|uniref:SH3 domain-containing protein n=1 Tax=unclassified Streptomyces TaxID=2593676 RepID=UPI00324BBEC8|nr:SH3 domain-containing protein [Streptomyces sp. NBC_01136]
MSLRHTLPCTGTALVAGMLIAVASATPALAHAPAPAPAHALALAHAHAHAHADTDGDWDDDGRFDDGRFDDDSGFEDGRFGDDSRDDRRFEGRITSRDGLALHTRPDRGSRIIRIAPFGERVHIFCKTSGARVGGNPIWYLLTDGTWAWGAARHIDIIGRSPRWC